MTPIEKVFKHVFDSGSNFCSNCMEMASSVGPLQLGMIFAMVLLVGAWCLRGNPVKGV